MDMHRAPKSDETSLTSVSTGGDDIDQVSHRNSPGFVSDDKYL